jgi:tripartite-type tricarboxylate transporter receptor subunit TctC
MRTAWATVILVVGSFWAALSAGAQVRDPAQSFPTRPIRWVVPVPIGGTNDILSRLFAPKIHADWGQQVIVDNRPGGAYVIGTDILAKAVPDGYTVGMLLSSHAVGPYAIKNLPYDPIKDFQPISMVALVPGVLVTRPDVPVSSVKDVIALAKSKPGQLNYGPPGQLSSGHMSMELLNVMGGVKITYVPYKGGAPAIQGVLVGEIQFLILSPPAVMGFIKSGRLKAIATTSVKRSPGLPNVPTFSESGLPGFDTTEWYAMFAPAKIPRPVLAKYNAQINRILAMPDIKQRMLTLGAIPSGGTPEELGAFVKSEMDRWGKVAREINLQPN